MASFLDFLSNIPLIITASFLVFTLLFYVYFCKQAQISKKYHPVGGTVFHMLINFKRLHHYMADLAAKYKTFRMINPLHGEIFTADPVVVEYILKTNFDNYGKGVYTYAWLSDFLGDGIFTVDGEKWREQRKLSSHEFSTKVVRDFSSVTFRKNAIKLGNIVLEAANNNQTVDINDLFMKATADSIFKVGFGIDVDNLSGSNEEGVGFTRAFDGTNEMTYRRLVDISWKIKRYLNIGTEAQLKKNVKLIDDFVYKTIRIKTQQMNNKPKDHEFSLIKKEDILSRFMQMDNKNPKFLRDIILSFLLAGRDPIATTMSWFIYMLCKHPDVQEKVAQVIKEATNYMKLDKLEITSVADFEATVTEDAIEKMQYLQAALAETIRLYPALPLDVKICFSDDVLPDGCTIKKGDMISYMPYAMGRMKFIWGDDALEFKPERWLDDNGCFHSESPFKFTAFQAGPRSCLGREFSYKQMKIFSSILVGCFVFKLSDENEDPKYKTTIAIQIDGPLNIYASVRPGLYI